MGVHFHQEGQHVGSQTNIGEIHAERVDLNSATTDRAVAELEALLRQIDADPTRAHRLAPELRQARDEIIERQPQRAATRLERLKAGLDTGVAATTIASSLTSIIGMLAGA